ncbi:MAG: hypothetical protein RL235_351 [Chlamydiota bacterium]|jgi:hypothetical protein
MTLKLCKRSVDEWLGALAFTMDTADPRTPEFKDAIQAHVNHMIVRVALSTLSRCGETAEPVMRDGVVWAVIIRPKQGPVKDIAWDPMLSASQTEEVLRLARGKNGASRR